MYSKTLNDLNDVERHKILDELILMYGHQLIDDILINNNDDLSEYYYKDILIK